MIFETELIAMVNGLGTLKKWGRLIFNGSFELPATKSF